jgi:fibronectin-binding autotransporter adhesin
MAKTDHRTGAQRKRLNLALMTTVSCVALAAAGMASTAAGADKNWDGNGGTIGAGGPGSWDTTTANWSGSTDGTSGPYTVWNNAALDRAIFGGTAGTVTINAPVTANRLTFNVHGYTLQSGTLTLGGATPTIDGAGNATISSILAGAAGLTKAGTGILSLTGANTFTGAVNLDVGTLSVGSNAALGNAANVVNLADAARLTSSATLAGRTVNLTGAQGQISGAGAGAAHFTGTGGLVAVTGSRLTDDTNDFTGKASIFTDGEVYFSSVRNAGQASSLGAGTGANATITFTGVNQYVDQAVYTGDGDTSDRPWEFTDAGSTPSATILTNLGTGTLTLTGGLAAIGPKAVQIQFNASSADLELLGVISSNNGRIFDFRGGGVSRTITLGGANTYSGPTAIGAGGAVTVRAPTLADTGVNSSFGTGSAGGLAIMSGSVLSYTGAGASSNRAVTIGGVAYGYAGSGSIRNDGAGALTLSGPVTFDASANNTLTLGGSYIGGANTISGVISGTGNLTSTGPATWALTGANTRTGLLTVSGGTLRAGSATAFGTVTGVTVSGGTLDLNGNDLSTPTFAGTGGAVALGSGDLIVNQATTTTYTGAISGSGGLTKRGTGSLTLTGANTYTGPTSLEAGTIKLDFSASGPTSNIIAPTSVLNISGASTLDIVGGAGETNIQTFGGLNVGAGANTIRSTAGTAGTLTVEFGAINRTEGQVNFTRQTGVTLKTSSDSAALRGWAMINNTDYAKVLGGEIVPFDNVDYTVRDDASTWDNTGVTSPVITETAGGAGFSGTVDNTVQLGGLRYTEPRTTTVGIAGGATLGVTGAILVSPDVGALNQTINGPGSITGASGAGGALGIQQNSTGNFTIAATVVDNGGATGFTKGGTGLVTLSGPNTYSGPTIISQGTLAATTIANGGIASSIGQSSNASSNLVIDSGTLRYTAVGATTTTDRGFTLAKSGAVDPAIEVADPGSTLTFTGQVVGDSAAGLTIKGSGKLSLTNTTNSYVGPTTIDGGTLSLATIANGGAPSTLGASSSASSNLVLKNGGELEYTGGTAATNRGFTLDSGDGAIDVTGAAPTTLTVSGVAAGAGRLIKNGPGILVLSGTNTYTGETRVAQGILRAGSTQAFGTTSGMVVDAGATLQLATFSNTVGNLTGAGTIDLGSGTLTLAGVGGGPVFTGTITGTGGVTREGQFTQVINGCNNTYDGPTQVLGGYLTVDCLANGGSPSAIGDSSAAPSNLVLSNGGLSYTGGNINIDRGFTVGGDGYLGVATGSTTLGIGGQVTGSGRLRKFGPGVLVLSGANNNYSGNVVDAGILRAGAANAFGTAYVYMQDVAGATLDLANFATSITSLQGGGATGGDVTLGSATLNITNGGNATYAGAISGTGGLRKSGGPGAAQVLTGCASSYTGSTVIESGFLYVSCLADGGANSSIGASLADPSNLVINGGTLTYTGAAGSTNRQFTVGTTAGSALDASGTGPINFTSTAPIALPGTNAARTFTLTGTNTGDNRLGALIADNGTGLTSLSKTGAGVWILTNPSSTFTGVTTISQGVLGVDKLADAGQPSSLGASANLATNLIIGGVSGGALRYTGAGDSTNRLFSIGQGSGANPGIGVIESSGSGPIKFTNTGAITQFGGTARVFGLGGTNTGDNTLAGSIGNAAGGTTLAKNDAGKWILTGTNTYAGPTNINAGTLQLGDGGTIGSITSASVSNLGALIFNRSDAYTYAGVVSGTGTVTQAGAGVTTLTGANIYTGGTTISAGTLQLGSGGTTGSIVGNVVDNGMLRFNRSDAVTFTGVISGTGAVDKLGAGTTTLTAANSYAGATTVNAGTLRINGNQSAATGLTTVFSGATLGGSGTIGGAVLVQNGGAIAPGNSPGTLTIAGALTLNSTSVLNMELGQANVPGGPLNDLINVGGALTLDGTLNVTVPAGGTFGPGVYRLINYGGALTDNGLAVGSMPGGATPTVQTAIAGQVNLVNGAGMSLGFWDAPASPKNDSIIQGGSGVWRVGGGTNAWTTSTGSINADYEQGSFAVFSGTAGTVTTDAAGGTPQATGLQFAVNGYTIDGTGLTLTGPQSTVVVGDGTAAGAAMTGTISAPIGGTTQLVKTDRGTLVLSGTNTYTGGTSITGGTVRISSDAHLGAAGGGLTLDGGTLYNTAPTVIARPVTLNAGGGTIQAGGLTTLSGGIVGSGALTKTGGSALTLLGASTYTGGTTLSGGLFLLGDGVTAGSILGDVLNNADLTFANPGVQTFTGVISGSGRVRKTTTTGTQVLTAANTYAGVTTVLGGSLLINGDQSGATGLTTVSAGTLGGMGVIGGDVTVANGAALAPGGLTGPGTLTINGGLILGGTSSLNYEFGQPNVPGGSLNDLTKVGGALTLDGTINVAASAGGTFGPGLYRVIDYTGALTNNGLTVGTTPLGTSFTVQTSVANQVNLVNAAGLTLNVWDGVGGRNDSDIAGGTGVWQGPGGNDNWTPADGSVNAPFQNNAFAIFAKTGGTVTVDATSNGAVNVSGMQFAVDGYTITGQAVNLVGPANLRVGDGGPDSGAVTATIASQLAGAGDLIKTDLGTLVVTGLNSYSGATQVLAGTLQVDGDQTAATGLTTVADGAILSGKGTIGGDVAVNAGGVLAPGAGIGTLTIKGALALDAGSSLEMQLGQAGTAGGLLNDLIVVGGDLTLDGTVNVSESAGGIFGPGVYRLIDYSGTLTDNVLNVGALPSGSATVQTSIAGQVNLVAGVTPPGGGGPGGPGGPGPGDPGGPTNPPPPPPPPPSTRNFWDAGAGADGRVAGGTGVWSRAATQLWTDANGASNGAYENGIFPIFAATAGTVTIDGAQGPVTASGMQFATDGYRLQGDPLTLTGTEAIVRVGDGTTAGAGFTATVASQITGAARLVKTDGGTLVLAGANTYTGGTTVSGGALVGSATSFGAGPIRNDAALVLDQATDASFANAIDGTGTLTKQGAGRLTYTGTGLLTGPTTVTAGTLAVNGSLGASAMTVRSGATLAGTGTVGATTLQSGSIIAPAEGAIGTLSVNGAFTQAAGSTYQLQLDPNTGASDRIAVAGAARIEDGAVLSVAKAAPGAYRPGTTYTVLTAAGGLTGGYRLAGDTMATAFLGLQGVSEPNRYLLRIDQVRPLEAAAMTWNQTQAARGVDGQALDNPLRLAALNLSSDEAARGAFDQLSGEALASAKGVLVAQSQAIRDAALARLTVCTDARTAGGQESCADDGRPAGWVQLLGGWSSIDGDGNAASVDHDLAGALTGVDAGVNGWRFGGFAGYSRSTWRIDRRASSGDSTDYHLGAYGGRGSGALTLRFGAGYSWHNVSSQRGVAFEGFSDRLRASYDASTVQAFADLGYRFAAGGSSFEPFVNLAQVRLKTQDLAETGGAAALSVRGQAFDSTVSTLGVRPSTPITLGPLQGRVKGMVGWRHAFGDVVPTASPALAGGTPFGPRGAPLARDAAALEVGLDLGYGPAVAAFTYGGQYAGDVSDQRLRLDVRVRF